MKRYRVLIVEDKENMRKLLLRVLADRYDVSIATDGANAIAQLEGQRYDVVLTDVQMPGADGFEVLRQVKRASPSTEVVMMTAYGSITDAVEAMRQGAYDYLTKPCDPDDVAFVLARAMQRKGQSEPEGPAPVAPPSSSVAETPFAELPYHEAVERARERASRDYLVALLTACKGNVTHAADRAGMERESLHRVLRRYGLRSEDFKR